MKNYEVRLSRKVRGKVHTTVSVFANSEAEAVEKAMTHARTSGEWSTEINDPVKYGAITTEAVEEIVEIETDA